MIAEPVIDEEIRALDPNVAQRRASNPDESVWVGASAGSGKTKVLTDRVLRLLLPRDDGRPGTAPHRILCLTFTKAGASEMLQRIGKILGKWAITGESELREDLRQLTGHEASEEEIGAARRLFASVVDTPGGLKVMTIHSFCQSVLGRFPLEARIPPHFSVVDEAPAQELLTRARNAVLDAARKYPASALGRAVIALATEQNEEQFGSLLRSLCGERRAMREIGGAGDLHNRLCALLGITPSDTPESLKSAACNNGSFNSANLYAACKALSGGTDKTDQPKGITIQRWLDTPAARRLADFESYELAFLTKDGEPRKNLSTKGVQQVSTDCEPALQAEAQRLFQLRDKIKAVKCASLTRDLFLMGTAILDEYQRLKDARGLLDYDDLILTTLALLRQDAISPWILYKLDGGLDHVLIDEAQDTNPEQWQIIRHLCEDFFSGHGARADVTRTVFVVGDEKQSIYSFQRASPAEFARMKKFFMERAKAKEEKLDISFRSAPSVLQLVDEVFAPPDLRRGLSELKIEHHSHRRGQAGLVELWPSFSPDEIEEEEPWTPPVNIVEAPSGQAKLAEHVGNTIKGWLDNNEILSSQDRPIQPGDIMILVRTRTAFVNQLVRALKTRNIPVSGVDRMVLGEQISVMDLLALAQFALLPGDDLSLACALKSPFIGMDEDRLMALAIDRKGSLWDSLRASGDKDIISWLEDLIARAAVDHPYEFFSRILQRPCPADDRSGLRAVQKRLGADALDPLGEFQNACLAFERDNIATLQGFLLWQQKTDAAIKRELEEAGEAVRIMTVHGSKGLQAPIVILPDTTRTSASKKNGTLLWPGKTGLDIPLWAPRSDDFPALCAQARTLMEEAAEEEYRRLLYVAMTRAEDRLYIGGAQGKRAPLEECWYNYITAAFARLPHEEDADGTLRVTNPQTAAPDTKKKDGGKETADETAPEALWLHRPAPAEAFPPRPLAPSRPADGPAVSSPLESAQDYRFRRGNITHKLLQVLPDLPLEERRQAALRFVSRPAHGLPENLQHEIVRETLAILEDPSFAPLFGPGSLAEVPLTGFVNGRLVSAQIDRLLVTDASISIVDYKTNRPPPRDPKDVPDVYRSQLQSYRDIVANIYPNRPISCLLLWTDGPLLMPLDV